MAKKFTGNSPSQGYSINPTIAQPLDIRQVVQYYTDLDLMDNPGQGLSSYTYLGMIVAVVEDQNPANNGVYYKKSNTGNSISDRWEKIGSGNIVGDQFVFTVNHIFTENNESYQESGSISSSTNMTLTNIYGSGDGTVSDVIAVKEETMNANEPTFHLMINPSLLYVLDGGTSMSTFISITNETRTTTEINS